MSDGVAQRVRQEVEHLLAKSAATSDLGEKRRLASRAFALAQSAESAERSVQEHRDKRQQSSANPVLDGNLKLVAEINLTRFLGCLYVETDQAQRKMYRNLLIQEQRWFAVGAERAEVLERLFRDCSDRVERQTLLVDAEAVAGRNVTRDEVLLNNMLETQAILRDLLQNELRRD